jgi:DNA polymerase III gamma/tau subunit
MTDHTMFRFHYRCQKYHFGKLKESEIVARLQTLAEKEDLDVEEAALLLISSRADGSLRDAEAMLDQLSLLDQTITLSMVQELVRNKLGATNSSSA